MGLHLVGWHWPPAEEVDTPTERLARVVALRTVRVERPADRHGFNWGLLAALLFCALVWAFVIYAAVAA